MILICQDCGTRYTSFDLHFCARDEGGYGMDLSRFLAAPVVAMAVPVVPPRCARCDKGHEGDGAIRGEPSRTSPGHWVCRRCGDWCGVRPDDVLDRAPDTLIAPRGTVEREAAAKAYARATLAGAVRK